MFSVETIPYAPAAINVLASPWNEVFTNASMVVFASGGAPVQSWSVVGNTIYFASLLYPIGVWFSLSGTAVTCTISQPFSVNNVTVESAKIVVATEAGGKPVSSASVTLSENGSSIADASSVDGEATFYVLPGNYTITGSYEGSMSNGTVNARDGVQSDITVDFAARGQQAMNQLFSYLLVFTALVGAAISVVVWVRAYRKYP